MRAYDPSKPLISLHVPKCAGSSFRKVLEQWYGRRLISHYERKDRLPGRRNLERGLFGRRRTGVCVHGHFNSRRGYGVRDYYPQADQFITILRDPFELHVSDYFYVKKKRERGRDWDGKPWDGAVDNRSDLATFLTESPRSYMLAYFPFELTMDNYRDRLEESFVHIGVAEDLQTSVDRLAERLGFPTVSVPRINVSKRNEAVPEGARERFIEANPLAWAVYSYALERYRQ